VFDPAGPAHSAEAPRRSDAAAAVSRLDGKPSETWPRLTPPVRLSLEHLLANYSAPITLTDLAAITGRTAFQLIRAFRKELGVTPHAMLIRIRIRHAKSLLARGEPIAGVAVDLGFVDQTHFGRHFKRIQNETPGRFRSAILAAGSLGSPSAFETLRAG